MLKQVWIAARWELRSFLAMQSIPEAAATQTWAALEPSERLKDLYLPYVLPCPHLLCKRTSSLDFLTYS